MEQHNGEKHQHDRPEIVQDAGLLRAQLRQAEIVERRVQKHPDQAEPRHMEELTARIPAEQFQASASKVKEKQRQKRNQAADRQRFQIRDAGHDALDNSCQSGPDQHRAHSV